MDLMGGIGGEREIDEKGEKKLRGATNREGAEFGFGIWRLIR